MLEIIDIKSAGNLLELKLGVNGPQWGDDWNDIPYESNASEVYVEYVKETKNVVYDIDYKVIPYYEYLHKTNSNKSMFDFVQRDVPYYYVVKNDNSFVIIDQIFLGDKITDHPLMKIV